MDELTKAIGGRGIRDRLALSNSAFFWLNTEEDPKELQKLNTVYQKASALFSGQKVENKTTRHELDDVFMSKYGSIDITGKKIMITDPEQLLAILRLCHDFCITPHTDRTIEISFSLNNLTHSILEASDEA